MTKDLGLRFESISKSFDATLALEDFSLAVRTGEFVTLLGPSGCGKSTALRIAAGFETPDSGQVYVGNVAVTDTPSRKRSMGMVFQNYSLFPHLSVRDNVAFGPRMHRRTRQDVVRATDAMLDLVRLTGLADRLPHQLSGGQQQRVALARALASGPNVLLLDEPLSALDAKVRSEVRDEIRRLTRNLGTTTLFVTHDQEEALGVSDRVCVMNAGRVEQIGSPTDVYDRPTSDFVASFVGEINTIRFGSESVRVRPEQIVLDADTNSAIVGRVVTSSFRGPFVRYEVALGDGQCVIATIPHGHMTRFSTDDLVGVTIQEVTQP